MIQLGLHLLAGVLMVGTQGPALDQTRVACVGDSITQGRGGDDNYPAQLQRFLGSKFSVTNFGHNGATVGSGLPYSSLPEYQAALTSKPDVVLILLGVNDTNPTLWERNRDSFVPDLEKLVRSFQSLPSKPKVYLGTPLPVFFGASDPRTVNIVTSVLPLEAQAARETDVQIIDTNSPFTNAGDLFPDALHPNLAGMTTLGQTFAEALAPQSLKAQWKVVRVTSQQDDEGPAQNAIDGDPDTYWHSQYSPKTFKNPQEIVVDMAESHWLSGFKYLPRQDGGANGVAKDYEIYVGDDLDHLELAAKGRFRGGSARKTVRFAKSIKGRYFRFVVVTEQSDGPYASAAELDVIRDPSKN